MLASASWWHVAWALIPLAGIGMLAAGRWKRLPSVAAIGVVMILSGVIGGLAAWFLHANQIKANKQLCERVAGALEQYREARGSYPEELGQLVPDFLAELPVPRRGPLASAPLWYTPSEPTAGFAVGYQAMRRFAILYSKGKWSTVPVP